MFLGFAFSDFFGCNKQESFTACFYHGEGEWIRPKSLKEVMDFGENAEMWEKRFGDYPITVINAEDAVLANVPQFLENEEKYRNQEEGGDNTCQAMNALKIPEESRQKLQQLL